MEFGVWGWFRLLGDSEDTAHGIYITNNMLRLFASQQGKGLVKVNGQPLNLVQPEILRFKVRFSHSSEHLPQRCSKQGHNGRCIRIVV